MMKKEPTTDKNYLQMTYLTKDWYLKYIFLKLSNLNKLLFFSFEQTFHWKEYTENRE